VEIFAFRADLFTGSPIDLTDFDVESNDGEHIGKIDEATYESDVSYVIVDTGHWILGKRRMLPAGVVTRVDPEANKVSISMTKHEVKQAPDYDHERHVDDALDYHEDVGGYYDPYGWQRATAESFHDAEADTFPEGSQRFL